MVHLSEERFLQGKTWASFLAGMSQNRERLLRVLEAIRLTQEDVKRARHAVSLYPAPLSVLVLTEDWCPDAIVNIPVIFRFVDAVPDTRLRFFYRSENPDLEAAYAEEDVFSIPVISVFDAQWREVARFVEHAQEIARMKAEWMAQFPDAARWRHSSDPEDQARYRQLMARRFAVLVRWYREGLWRFAWEEILHLLEVGEI